MNRWIRMGRWCAASLLFTIVQCVPAMAPTEVFITVSQKSDAKGLTRYFYTVTNRSKEPITYFRIGLEVGKDPEVRLYPLGWRVGTAAPPKGSLNAPAGWQASVMRGEESDKTWLDFQSSGTVRISAGETASGFSVLSPKADDNFSRCHWSLTFASGTLAGGVLQPAGAATATAALEKPKLMDGGDAGRLGPGRLDGDAELSRLLRRDLAKLEMGRLDGLSDSLEEFRRIVVDGIGGRWQRDPSPGQMEKGSRTSLIMSCRKYLRGTEHAVGNYPGLLPKYVAAKQALDRASPYRDAYLQ